MRENEKRAHTDIFVKREETRTQEARGTKKTRENCNNISI